MDSLMVSDLTALISRHFKQEDLSTINSSSCVLNNIEAVDLTKEESIIEEVKPVVKEVVEEAKPAIKEVKEEVKPVVEEVKKEIKEEVKPVVEEVKPTAKKKQPTKKPTSLKGVVITWGRIYTYPNGLIKIRHNSIVDQEIFPGRKVETVNFVKIQDKRDANKCKIIVSLGTPQTPGMEIGVTQKGKDYYNE